MRKIPDKLVKIEPQAIRAQLAYVRGPHKRHELHQEAALYLKDLAWEKSLITKYAYQEQGLLSVVLNTSDKAAPEKSINALIIKKGYAKLDSDVKLPEVYNCFKELNTQAQEQNLGLWLDNDNEDND